MKTLIIKTNYELIKVKMADVNYIVTHPTKKHYVQVTTDYTSYDLATSLTALEEIYPDELYRCHRNCLVNLSNIKEVCFKERELIVGNQEQNRVSFSRRRYNNIVTLWLNQGD